MPCGLQFARRFAMALRQIKLMVSGGVLSESDPIWSNQFSDEEIAAAVAETGARRAYVMAHAHGADAAARCARLGVRSVEHGTLIDAPTAVELAAAGTYVVPTLGIIDALRSLPVGAVQSRVLDKLALVGDQARAAVAACRDAGVRLGLGTDLLGELQTRQSREFLMRAEIQPALDVLKSATSINAEMMMMEGELGKSAWVRWPTSLSSIGIRWKTYACWPIRTRRSMRSFAGDRS